jgi:hypothetical protein
VPSPDARALHAYLRWHNANARHRDVLAAEHSLGDVQAAACEWSARYAHALTGRGRPLDRGPGRPPPTTRTGRRARPGYMAEDRARDPQRAFGNGPEGSVAAVLLTSRLERVLMAPLRTWSQAGPDAAEGIARAVIAFVVQEDHEGVADIHRQLTAVGVGQALNTHPHRPMRNRCKRPSRSAHRTGRCGAGGAQSTTPGTPQSPTTRAQAVSAS